MRYGKVPKNLGKVKVKCDEMMYYQYLLVKLPNQTVPTLESRLKCFHDLIGKVICDFIGEYGLNTYNDSHVYVTAKRMYQCGGNYFNRLGYHTDGFMTSDINYIWSDINPTVFNDSEFNLTQDDLLSMKEMEEQAMPENEFTYENESLIRLDQYSVHRVGEWKDLVIRTFVKISFSKDRYDLKGNSINREIDYDWEMRDRMEHRNIPQKI